MKTLFKLSKYSFLFGVGLWFTETLIFQILYGFHYEPINKTELYFDRISQMFMLAGFILLILGLVKFIDKIIEEMPD